MSVASNAGNEIVSDRRQLVAYLESGCKPAAEWRVGTEHEKFLFRKRGHGPVAYEGDDGVRALLEGLKRFGWGGVYEGETLIGLTQGMANISLEPGGQFELSGAPLDSIHDAAAETATHLAQVKEVAGPLGIGLLGMGFQPSLKREDVPWMPKGRYAIMRAYMPKRGNEGQDMMLRTCTIQANLDFESEACMVKKFRVSLALQPIATALFANSPFKEGKPSGFKSRRSQVWTDTDPDRTGDLPFVFEDGFGFERYVDYALDVPMYFVLRGGRYVDVSGQSFRDFLRGELPGLPGELPTMSDWADHMTTIFPEVRLKKYLEMRGADGGPAEHIDALPALWTGLLYDRDSLTAAWDLVKGWTTEVRAELRASVPRDALAAMIKGRTARDVAREILALSRSGLKRRARLNAQGQDETIFLEPLERIAESGQTLADQALAAYAGAWGGSVAPAFAAYAY
ncbi:MAG TPA: glutamate--cysteine ligase [Alphaproteobacteria bacterium]|nr:glutamate--cysteine ligase [Alphaproteobacteria bacterium]